MNNLIPIFFATDNNYIPFLSVAIKSIILNANLNFNYEINILSEKISKKNIRKIKKLENKNFKINFVNLSPYIKKIRIRLKNTLRDYYTEAIFYRIFIASLYPSYNKAIYLDCDLVVNSDISKLFEQNIDEYILGVVSDDVIAANPDFRIYAKEGVGIEYQKYFNSGVLLINLDKFRSERIKEKFIYYLVKYNFQTAAPDQDYLNVICKNNVKFLDKGWNTMSVKENKRKNLYIIHYNNFKKPWYYENVPYEKYFWKYAEQTNFYKKILNIKNSFNDQMAQKHLDGADNLLALTKCIINSENNFKKILEVR